MKILPPLTLPPSARIERRHQPDEVTGRYGYRAYRACLRWEFGFTCAFCLLHEADFAPFGAEGLGLMTIEHFVPVSADEEKAGEYGNCYYACRLCNQSRSKAPVVDRRKRRLLDPCQHVWSDHFRVHPDGRFLPIDGDPDAAYTARLYDLNDERRLALRDFRRQRLTEALRVIREAPEEIQMLLDQCAVAPPERSVVLLRAATRLRSLILLARLDLQRFAAIPRDADDQCRCGHRTHHSLPAGLSEQTFPPGFKWADT